MTTLWLTPAIIGLVLMCLSILGSDLSFDLNFGSDLSGHAMTAVVGAFLGVGGGAGLIASGLGLSLTPACAVAGLAGFVSAWAAGKLTAFLANASSDGGDSSIMDAVNQVITTSEDMAAGSIGATEIKIGGDPQKLYYKTETAVKKGDRLRVAGVNFENNVLMVEPVGFTVEDDLVPSASPTSLREAQRRAKMEAEARNDEASWTSLMSSQANKSEQEAKDPKD